MVMDNSQSVKANSDSGFYRTDFLKQWLDVKQQLGKDYEVEYLTAGSSTRLSDSINFNEKRTNLGHVMDYINQTYAKQNIGAVVLSSDGVVNKGSNPLYKHLDYKAPLYTVGMGDSMIKKDIVIKELNLNAIAYLGNDFPIDINMASYECNGANTVLTISIDGKVITSQPVNINQKDFFKNFNIPAKAEQSGTRHVVATLSTIEGEVSKVNNRKDAFIEIIDGREKILLAYQSPHPDIGAIKEAIGANTNYELVSLPGTDVKIGDISQYSVVILHQLPSRTSASKEILTACRQSKIPVWCIVGNQTATDLLQTVSPLAKVNNSQGRMNDVQGVVNTNFNLFTLEENTVGSLPEFPPMKAPYGVYPGLENMEILAYQKIGAVTTKLPLWAFVNEDGAKSALLFGEGFWRWRIADYVANENHLATNELVSKTIQYLATKDDKRKFRVYPVKNVYEEDEAIKFIAEIYNSNYELINTADVKLELTNEAKKTFKYTFSPYARSYQLDIGLMPPGIYRFKATADGMQGAIAGQVLVTPIQAELVNTRADFGMMRQLAKQNNGRFYKAKELNELVKAIQQNTDITSMSYVEKKVDELINVKWIFFLIFLLLAFEWFVRKYEGGY